MPTWHSLFLIPHRKDSGIFSYHPKSTIHMNTKENRWTEEEVEYLSSNYAAIPAKDISRTLSPRHSAHAVYNKAAQMGITRKCPPRNLYDNEAYKGMSVKEQALTMGVSYSSVYRHRRLYGKKG